MQRYHSVIDPIGFITLLVEDVAYNGATGSAALTFRPSGIRALAKEATR